MSKEVGGARWADEGWEGSELRESAVDSRRYNLRSLRGLLFDPIRVRPSNPRFVLNLWGGNALSVER